MSDPGNVAQLPVLRLKRNEDRRLHAGHLWIFSNEVDTAQSPLVKFKPGELVRVLAHNDRALGLAYVNPKSLIAARMLQTWKIPDVAWLVARIYATDSARVSPRSDRQRPERGSTISPLNQAGAPKAALCA